MRLSESRCQLLVQTDDWEERVVDADMVDVDYFGDVIQFTGWLHGYNHSPFTIIVNGARLRHAEICPMEMINAKNGDTDEVQ